jgi:hypothetical protein
MKGRYIQRVGIILQMVQLKNYQTYYNKMIALLIVATEKGEDIKWANVFFQGLKLNMGHEAIYNVCGPCHGHVAMKVVST